MNNGSGPDVSARAAPYFVRIDFSVARGE